MAKPRMRSPYLRSEAPFLIRSAVMAVADSPVYGRSPHRQLTPIGSCPTVKEIWVVTLGVKKEF